MERESFENPDIGKLMNEHFVNIKVDREERPDVDRVYMTFVQVCNFKINILFECVFLVSVDDLCFVANNCSRVYHAMMQVLGTCCSSIEQIEHFTHSQCSM